MAARRPGPPPKGEREQTTLRLPVTHLRVYREQAEREGVPVGDLITRTLARAFGLPEPSYLEGRTTKLLAALRAYIDEHGHASPSANEVVDLDGVGVPIGRRVAYLRRAYRQGRLSPEVIDNVEDLPGWRWDPRAENAEARQGKLDFDELLEDGHRKHDNVGIDALSA